MKNVLIKSLVGIMLVGGGFGSAWLIQQSKINNIKEASTRQLAQINQATNKAIQEAQAQVKNSLVEYKGEITEEDPNFYKEDGSRLFELTDGSWIIVNEEKGEYIFQPVDLGDWDYELENMEQLQNIVKTYISMKNTGTW